MQVYLMANCVERVRSLSGVGKSKMMFHLTIILFVTATIYAEETIDFEKEWQKFLKDFQPEYTNPKEEEYRKTIFMNNLKEIRKHNEEYEAGLHTYSQAVNQFADETRSELIEAGDVITESDPESKIDLARTWNTTVNLQCNSETCNVDWRKQGAVTGIRNQGKCHSSWAFSAIGAVEGQYYFATGQLVAFSDQQLVDCSKSNTGCCGGSIRRVFHDLQVMGGVVTNETYPYIGEQRNCKFSEDTALAKVTGYKTIERGNEAALKDAVARHGPISASILNTDAFRRYKEGIFYDKECKPGSPYKHHAVLIIGYGTENGKDYWLIKNSWGENWGQGGYGKVARNKNNHCDIARKASYPIVEAISRKRNDTFDFLLLLKMKF